MKMQLTLILKERGTWHGKTWAFSRMLQEKALAYSLGLGNFEEKRWVEKLYIVNIESADKVML